MQCLGIAQAVIMPKSCALHAFSLHMRPALSDTSVLSMKMHHYPDMTLTAQDGADLLAMMLHSSGNTSATALC